MHGELQAVVVRDAVNAVLFMVEPQLVAKRLDSVADIPPDVRLVANPEKLRGILLTLLSNAIEYNQPGGHVMVDVGYPVEGMPEDVVLLRVGDSGCGIPADRQEAIFTPSDAARAESGRTRPTLATCREWARAMGGDLRVRSEVDRGSVFTLKLPRATS